MVAQEQTEDDRKGEEELTDQGRNPRDNPPRRRVGKNRERLFVPKRERASEKEKERKKNGLPSILPPVARVEPSVKLQNVPVTRGSDLEI